MPPIGPFTVVVQNPTFDSDSPNEIRVNVTTLAGAPVNISANMHARMWFLNPYVNLAESQSVEITNALTWTYGANGLLTGLLPQGNTGLIPTNTPLLFNIFLVSNLDASLAIVSRGNLFMNQSVA